MRTRSRRPDGRRASISRFIKDDTLNLKSRTSSRPNALPGRFLVHTAELAALGAWALFVGRSYLNFDPHMVPTGGELGTHAAANHLWIRVLTCGWCAVWNGSVQGGLPALADTVSSTLHPVVMIATLLFGVVNGVKVTLLVALWLAGVAQWWMARELRLGAPARLWSPGEGRWPPPARRPTRPDGAAERSESKELFSAAAAPSTPFDSNPLAARVVR